MATRTTREHPPPKRIVADVAAALDRIAPPELAQEWDNVGLLLGDAQAPARRMLLCIDLTPEVLREARRARVDFVFAYHPPLFKPISRILAASRGTDSLLFGCVRAGLAVYSSHTALDAAEGGTNDVIAAFCGIRNPEPLEYVRASREANCKLIVFVPSKSLEQVAEALFQAGAGRIGDYTRCSFRLEGEGTFRGGGSTKPAVGRHGRFERVKETRLEVVVPLTRLAEAVEAVRRSHPYEEPAFDIHLLQDPPLRGIGRQGALPEPITLQRLARQLSRQTRSKRVSMVGDPRTEARRAVILVGAAGDLPLRSIAGKGDVVITGELRHHDALAIHRASAAAIALGHWHSERPVLGSLQTRIKAALPWIQVFVSKEDADPFRKV